MIELIVLGIVPGTSIQITLTHFVILCWFVFVYYCFAPSIARKQSNGTNNTQTQRLTKEAA